MIPDFLRFLWGRFLCRFLRRFLRRLLRRLLFGSLFLLLMDLTTNEYCLRHPLGLFGFLKPGLFGP